MKPKDLKYPFLWENRCPKIENNVLYVPKYYFDHEHISKSLLKNYFANTNTIIDCELCSGNGDWVIAQAMRNPDIHWVAVEQRFDRVRKIWSKMHNAGVRNLLIVCGAAQVFLEHYVEQESFRQIFVNFPDPWPKCRHHKHRLFQDHFVENVVKVLVKSGKIILATDDMPYLQFAISAMQKKLSASIEAPFYRQVEGSYGGSWFENLWLSKGKQIFYTEFEKNGI